MCFFVFNNTFLQLNINVEGWMLKYFTFIMIICSRMFIDLQVSSFFNIWIVNEAICVLNDVLKDLLFYSMILVFVSISIRTAIQTMARRTKFHNISLWVGDKVTTISAAGAVHVNILNKPSNCNIDDWIKRKTERGNTKTNIKTAKNRARKKKSEKKQC